MPSPKSHRIVFIEENQDMSTPLRYGFMRHLCADPDGTVIAQPLFPGKADILRGILPFYGTMHTQTTPPN